MKINQKGGVSLILIALLIILVVSQTPEDDEVDTTVPGYPHKFYSGYLQANRLQKKIIHYVFFPSQKDQSSDPLVIWLTGGPGCSSLLACFHENGPFIFERQKPKFVINENSWNKKANLLYLELPGGVGFSEIDDESATVTDLTFTKDAYYTIRQFFTRFPAYISNEIYLTGQGYAGVYIAYLAKAIIEQNNNLDTIYNYPLNLKGMMVGNPCVRPEECYETGIQKYSYYHYQFLYNRAFYSKKVWDQFRGVCAFGFENVPCYQKRIQMDEMFANTNVSKYNIYDKCYKTKNKTDDLKYVNTGCQDDVGIITYLNDPIVRKNWNIQTSKEWTPCNNKIFQKYKGDRNSYWIYPFLIQSKLRIWIFSGDLDSSIPIIGTKRWIEDLRHELQMPVKRIWREWWVPGFHKGQDQVGGFIWQLRDLTFVTVKGAGFRAAYDQPQAMSEVLAGFLSGLTLPYKNT